MTQLPTQSNPSPEQKRPLAADGIDAQPTEAQKKRKMETPEKTGADKASSRDDHRSSQGNYNTKQ